MHFNRRLLSLVLVLVLTTSLFAESSILVSPRLQKREGTTTEKQLPDAENVNEKSYSYQLGGLSEGITDQDVRLLRAVSDASYPVTVGDVYTLTYAMTGSTNLNPIVLRVQVPYSKKISFSSFGSFDVTGKTYMEIKDEVENTVLHSYPYSNPQLQLISTGIFPVIVKGEVQKTQEMQGWGLSRLSEMVLGASDTASTRMVEVAKRDGTKQVYDLYAALREGNLAMDPLMESGDVVTLVPRGKMISITGSVSRPGMYQIENQEDAISVIRRYGKGFLPSSSVSEVFIRRYDADGGMSQERINGRSKIAYALKDGDVIYVPGSVSSTHSVSIEGALLPPTTYNANTNLVQGATPYKYFYQYDDGETLLEMLKVVSAYFSASSDLGGCYLVRKGVETQLDLEEILFSGESNGQMRLEEGDRFVIPFNQLQVNVIGAVNNAGIFGYVPNKTANYYLSLAGGLNSSAKGMNKVKVSDKHGKTLGLDDIVPPESTIDVPRNNVVSNLAPTVAVIGIVGTLVTIAYNVTRMITSDWSN